MTNQEATLQSHYQNISPSMSTQRILKTVESLQGIQKTHSPKSANWNMASTLLAPLFAELANRQKNGDTDAV